jgi:predicted PhzF superfamily epimerase YddE/YHI9
MPYNLFQVDAFTEEPFKGNPAGVCLLKGQKSDSWMQSLAAELNLSETAFLISEGKSWRLRWFTPKTEVDLCGHATLASAMVLFETQRAGHSEVIKFQTLSGVLLARCVSGGVELDFPAMPYQILSYEPPIKEVLGFDPVAAVFSGDYFLFEAKNEILIRQAQPEMLMLEKLPMPEVIITAKSDHSKFDFISRFFAPQLGVDEDPVTGSAHCLLAPYWANKLGKREFNAFQASRRGGSLHLRLDGARVRIRGAAKLIFKAELMV